MRSTHLFFTQIFLCAVLFFSFCLTAKDIVVESEDLFLLEGDDDGIDQDTTRLSVARNISMNDSVDQNIGNIIKSGVRFIHNFGKDNTFVGKQAGNFTTGIGIQNVGIGVRALRRLTSGSINTAVGFDALRRITTGLGNIAVGALALTTNTAGDNNVAVGTVSLAANTIGSGNIAVGRAALNANTQGTDNIAIGRESMLSNKTGNINIAIGIDTLKDSSSGSNNIAIGASALSGSFETKQNTIAIGSSSMLNRASTNNTIVGHRILSSGFQAIENTTVIGNGAFTSYLGGRNDTVIGVNAGQFIKNGDPVNSGGNIIIGFNAGSSITSSCNSTIIIGSSGKNSAEGPDSDGQIFIGEDQQKCFIAGIYNSRFTTGRTTSLKVGDNGQLATIESSRKVKDSIQQMDHESDRIYDLNPVTFVYKYDREALKQFGLIAEEVDAAFPELVIYDQNGEPFSVCYEVLPVLLLNEMKKQKQETYQLRKMVAQLQEKLDRFMAS